MRVFLNKIYLFIIILTIACNQVSDPNFENSDKVEESIEAIYEVPITLSDELKKENNFDDWSEFKLLESSVLVIANSISGYIENDFNFLSDNLETLSRYSTKILDSEFEIFQNSPEIKGRLKLLNIQVQKTNLNIKNWTKKQGLDELNKIFIFYNYSVKTINSIVGNDIIG